jgi:mannose-6-phosphate isomerase-like protein (cupin superfamily)
VTSSFETKRLTAGADAVAPDGSDVRILLRLPAGSLAHFSLPPRKISVATRHRTIFEIWYFLSGAGHMWRRLGDRAEVVDVQAGTSLTIPVGTEFQFRSTSDEPLVAVGVTMPPWPGPGEAEIVSGPWPATVDGGPV